VLILRWGIVHGLRMRLRAQEWIRRHPAMTASIEEWKSVTKDVNFPA
jgi:hypothetical protein